MQTMLSLITWKGNANENLREIPLYTHQKANIGKTNNREHW